SLRDLAAVSRLPAEVHLIGSHGAESDMAFAHVQSLATEAALQKANTALSEAVGFQKGIWIERKPVAVAVHTRPATPEVMEVVTERAREIARSHGLFFIVDGSVLDLSVVEPAKAEALETLRSRLGASAAMYAGDAYSDELAISTLRGPDMGLRVGPGETGAAHRLRDPESFARVLAMLFELRRAWLFGEDAVGLERHSMIGNGSATALVTPDAKICWMSHPLPDSGSLFAHILGGDAAGHFSVEPVKASQVLGQRYVDSTMIVETRWADVTVTDYLEPAPEGITSLVRALSGSGAAKIVFAPRPDYANAPFSMEARGDELHVVGTSDPIILFAPGVSFTITSDGLHATATASVNLMDGPVVLNLRCGDTEPAVADPGGETDRRAAVAHHSR
ncbi:MAG TPA: trehalose-phosphatase, partial [Arthrobacter bacterium]|nr:trehalose-phosphatase [Arthrobacter sp.]